LRVHKVHFNRQTAYDGSNVTHDGFKIAYLGGIVPHPVGYDKRESRAVIVAGQKHIDSFAPEEAIRFEPPAECLRLGLGYRALIVDSSLPSKVTSPTVDVASTSSLLSTSRT
jgi:hypothetical protein